MRKFILLLVPVFTAVLAFTAPSVAQTDPGYGSLGASSVTAKFISKEFGGEIVRKAAVSGAQRFQGFQIDTDLFHTEHVDFITETSYSQVSSNGLKSWVFDASLKPVAYKRITPNIKLFGAGSLGLARANVKTSHTNQYKETELIWSLATGAELNQGRLSLLISVGYEWMDEFGKGAEVETEAKITMTDRLFLNTGLGYNWNPQAFSFNIGMGLRF